MTSTSAGAVALPPTRVTYPAGAVASEGTVLRVDARDLLQPGIERDQHPHPSHGRPAELELRTELPL